MASDSEAGSGVEERITITRHEPSCCSFFDFTIAVHGDQVW